MTVLQLLRQRCQSCTDDALAATATILRDQGVSTTLLAQGGLSLNDMETMRIHGNVGRAIVNAFGAPRQNFRSIHVKSEPLSPQRPAARRGLPGLSGRGQGFSPAAVTAAGCGDRFRNTKRSRGAVPVPSPPQNQGRSSHGGAPSGIADAGTQMAAAASLAAAVHGGARQHSAPFPGFPHAPSGPAAAAASRDISAAAAGAGSGKQGSKRRNAQEIAVLVEQRRAALKAEFDVRGLAGTMWKSTQRPGTSEAKAFKLLLNAINAQFPTIRRKKEEKGRDKGQLMLAMQFKALCHGARARRPREGDASVAAPALDDNGGNGGVGTGPSLGVFPHNSGVQAVSPQDDCSSASDSFSGSRGHEVRPPQSSLSARTATPSSGVAATQNAAEAGAVETIKVACRCGSVELVAAMGPSRVFCCHCTSCQRLTGSDYAHLAWFHPEQLVVVRGAQAISTWQAGSDAITWHHCSSCVARLFASRTDPDNPAHVMRKVIGVGTVVSRAGLRDPAWAAQEHIFYSERIVDVDDGCPKWRGHRGSELMQ